MIVVWLLLMCGMFVVHFIDMLSLCVTCVLIEMFAYCRIEIGVLLV